MRMTLFESRKIKDTKKKTLNNYQNAITLTWFSKGKKTGSVANSVFEGIEGINLHILQTGIAKFTGVF
jgi:hypothetical protein